MSDGTDSPGDQLKGVADSIRFVGSEPDPSPASKPPTAEAMMRKVTSSMSEEQKPQPAPQPAPQPPTSDTMTRRLTENDKPKR